MTAHDDRARDEQPAEAERLRLCAAERGPGDVGGGWVRVVLADDLRAVLADYDELRAKLARSHRREGQAGDLLDKRDNDVRNLQAHLAEAVRERDTARAEVAAMYTLLHRAERERNVARAEVERLRAMNADFTTAFVGMGQELERLRARVAELEPIAQRARAWATSVHGRDRHVASTILGEGGS